MVTRTKQEQVNLRMTSSQRALLDQAAAAEQTSRSEFILRAAIREAQEALDARGTILVSSDAFAGFERMLDEPVPANAALRELLHERAPWDE